jgi:pyridinium-3,5-bisthiocarboxylic acid mononucleotide nickel chelatase
MKAPVLRRSKNRGLAWPRAEDWLRYIRRLRSWPAWSWEGFLDIRLDPLGGLSGDMFVAALLDAFPEYWPHVQSTIASLNLGAEAECRLAPHHDHSFAGSRFLVGADYTALDLPAGLRRADSHDNWSDADKGSGHHAHTHTHEGRGGQRAWAGIRAELNRSGLDADVKKHAVAIFELLAEAEAKVHGVEVDLVTFHEVGAIDSVVDIVSAAQLISLIRADRWTSAPLPIGSGRISTAHGVLPAPAPAAALLMQGLPVVDDGIPGERVTPTGAALAAYLVQAGAPLGGRTCLLSRSGVGFGARTLRGISNCLRVLALEEATAGADATAAGPIGRRQLAVVTFEVDDQCMEDLAAGLDHIRTLQGVFDVTQSSVVGKKGRMAAHVQVLVSPLELENVIVACFEETTTIGLRYQLTEGAILRRRLQTVEMEGEKLRVKIVDRPGGVKSGKAEAADVASHRGRDVRARLRGEAVALALDPNHRDRNGAAYETEEGL